VIVISTDYRDLRKGAFQQYAVARDFNVVKIPWHLPIQQGSTVGVVFVAAALALGVCMGVDFSSVCDGPNLLDIVRSLDPEVLPKDIRQECLEGISKEECAKAGDWLAIWGGKYFRYP
jgi:NADPH:quinone reductase-like Zn-dependent oxidoreductase